MSYELWTAPITGYRRRGTRLSEIRSLEYRGFDVAGVQYMHTLLYLKS